MSAIDFDKYLRICEQLGQEPDVNKVPLTPSDFPEEVQVALFVYSLLTDVWDGMSGTFLGKDWSGAQLVFDTYNIEEPRVILYLTKMYEGLVVAARMEEAEKKRKAEERKQKSSAGGGKNYTHNVKG